MAGPTNGPPGVSIRWRSRWTKCSNITATRVTFPFFMSRLGVVKFDYILPSLHYSAALRQRRIA